jgi:tartrate dehydrogenase/decarboxylase/D-malate dehydrogenase
MQSTVITRRGAERLMRFAFDLARRRNGKKYVHCVTKSNALALVMELWDSVFATVAADYPDVWTTKSHVDAMSMYVVTRPASFDVVVATNLMGDIISDEAAAVTGSIGLAASANLNPARTGPSMFEPIHGSAPDIAGRGIANPLATIAAGALLLDWLGEVEASRLVQHAIEAVLQEGLVRTPDLGGSATTAEMTDAIVAQLRSARSSLTQAES